MILTPKRTRHTRRQILVGLAFASALLASTQSFAAQKLLYRYVNEQGVKVLNHIIPPKYAQNGYEVINESGQVVRVVPPAPTEDEIAAANARRALQEEYKVLRRRYSNIEEIEEAKQRQLESVETSIAILRGNVSNLTGQIENHMSKAAAAERAGREVPEHVLTDLANSRAELTITEELMTIRQEERDKIVQKYDADIMTFVKGQSLEAQQLRNAQN
ncbi:hypothetical protein KO528_06850 [Saccharophagus degradans]|uniref:DUF4124 domain-containing protein n=1 Tax=Saccharophagus degradans TaxID=86304 RepID=A0AAW7X8C5_9GAMM|nr:hypothetical protein [Saccharophagus degradans]MBU2985061.1 hypothetical protein [Saccharophagus degradans]MDO6423933.1 hypothetical protein [Saccharophagus degradans]MDO6608010.1 hypothetical protein [Saccharophagus degradans]WGO98888.1 hypothetical protein QFX18_02285 [Saccharophagus degradans]